MPDPSKSLIEYMIQSLVNESCNDSYFFGIELIDGKSGEQKDSLVH